MSFAVVLEGMTLAAYIVILGGGRQKREAGWKILSFMLMFTGLVQCAAMAIMVSERWFPHPVLHHPALTNPGDYLRQGRSVLCGLEA